MNNQEKKFTAEQLTKTALPPEEVAIMREVANAPNPGAKLKELVLAKKLPAGMAEKYKGHIKEIVGLLNNQELAAKSKIQLLKQLQLPLEIFAVIGKILAEKHFSEEGAKLWESIETLQKRIEELERQGRDLYEEGKKIESLDQPKLAQLRQTVDDLIDKTNHFSNVGELLREFATGLGLTYENSMPYDKEVARLKRDAKFERMEKLEEGQPVEPAPYIKETLEWLDKLAEGTFDQAELQKQIEKVRAKDELVSHLFAVERSLEIMGQDEGWREIRNVMIRMENARIELETIVALLPVLDKDLLLQTELLKKKYPELARQQGLVEENQVVEITDQDIEGIGISETLTDRMQKRRTSREARKEADTREYAWKLLNQFSLKELEKIVKRFPAFSKGTNAAAPHTIIREELVNALRGIVLSLNSDEINLLKAEIRRVSQETIRRTSPKQKWGYQEEETELLIDETDFLERFERARGYLDENQKAQLSPLPPEKKMLVLAGMLRKIANTQDLREKFIKHGLMDVLHDQWINKLESLMKEKIFEKLLKEFQAKLEGTAVRLWNELKRKDGTEINDRTEQSLKNIAKLFQNYRNAPAHVRTAVNKMAAKTAAAN